MQRDEFVMAVHTICEDLSLLDPGSYWEFVLDKGHSSYIPICNKNRRDEELAIHYHERENKYHISANWPWRNGQSLAPHRPYDYKGQWFSFGCSAAKMPAIVAREIHRRLLGDYRLKLDEVLEEAQRLEDAETRRSKRAEEICGILQIPYRPDRKSNHGYPEISLPYQYCPGIEHLKIETARDDDFRIDLGCRDIALLGQILAVIMRHITLNRKPEQNVAEDAHA